MILTLSIALGVSVILLIIAWVCWRFIRRRWRQIGTALSGLTIVAALPGLSLSIYLGYRLLAGQPSPVSWPIGNHAVYSRYVVKSPNRAVVHVVEIADARQCRFQVTPPIDTPDGPRNAAGFGIDAANAMQADVLINASFFTPFYDNWIFDAYPRPGDFVEPLGPVVTDGVRYGKSKPNWIPFSIGATGNIGFGEMPADVRHAVTGRQWLVHDGIITAEANSEPYPRTIIASDASRRRLWLVVVDGKQPRYSDGLTYRDLAGFLTTLGVTDAIELDGGGSSILIARQAGRPVVLSRPCHTKIPGRQRPTAVFLGVRVGTGSATENQAGD